MIDPVKKSCQITKDPMNPVEQICTNSSEFKKIIITQKGLNRTLPQIKLEFVLVFTFNY